MRIKGRAAVRNVRVPEAVALIAQAVHEEVGDPHTSVRAVARNLGVSKTTVHRAMQKDLALKPWKRKQVHELKPGDLPIRARVCEELLDRVDEAEQNPRFQGDRFLNRVIWTDECTVSSEGHFNPHNEHHWAAENPRCTAVTHVQGKFAVNNSTRH
ncbi:Stomatin-like protein 1 [Frankliniella fusca]|uniref:Stomatin-like protein 1 n=1 Tax=Frankliniella fusca TaxID=407009 RepID=A0AAE1H6R1_9NEOP|nr:Stomatin-like protein 1 [Frankliniella fusca]